MSTVIERLRVSKEKYENDERQAGLDAGRKWAMNVAEYDELMRVAACEEPFQATWGFVIPQAALNDDSPSASDIREFWTVASGSDDVSEDYAAGFAEGASEVFAEVEDEL